MRKLLKMKPLVIFALFLVLFSCRPPAQEEGGDEEVFGAAPVRVVRVKKQKISEKLFYTGTIEPWQKVNITPDVGGKVAKIYVEEGDRVKEGQVLAELDTRAIRLQLKQTEAGLAVAEANYKDAERNMERMDRLIDEKAVSAMAAALVSIGGRVGTALSSGEPKNIVIEGKDKMVIVRQVAKAALIATAPSGAKIGLIDFEMDKATDEIRSIL